MKMGQNESKLEEAKTKLVWFSNYVNEVLKYFVQDTKEAFAAFGVKIEKFANNVVEKIIALFDYFGFEMTVGILIFFGLLITIIIASASYIHYKNKQKELLEGSKKDIGGSKEELCVPEGLGPLDKQCISLELADLLNTETTTKMTRGQVIKTVWNYVKEHNLQDPTEQKYIIPDCKMAAVFGNERFDGFIMPQYLERHYKRDYGRTFVIEECEPEGLGPFDKQYLSNELAALINVDKGTKLTRGEVVKKVWNYIDEHNLKDPKNTRFVLPDDKMSAVFGKKSFVGFSMTEQLEKHYKRKFMKVNPTFNGTEDTPSTSYNKECEIYEIEKDASSSSLTNIEEDFEKVADVKENFKEGNKET